jgi:hypothetical protein
MYTVLYIFILAHKIKFKEREGEKLSLHDKYKISSGWRKAGSDLFFFSLQLAWQPQTNKCLVGNTINLNDLPSYSTIIQLQATATHPIR